MHFYLAEATHWLAGAKLARLLRGETAQGRNPWIPPESLLYHEDTTTECTLLRKIGH